MIGTARAAKHHFVRALGADEVIDYTTTDPARTAASLDVIFDPVGAAGGRAWLPLIRPGGMLIPFAYGDDQALIDRVTRRGIRVAPVLVEPMATAEDTPELIRLGQIEVVAASCSRTCAARGWLRSSRIAAASCQAFVAATGSPLSRATSPRLMSASASL